MSLSETRLEREENNPTTKSETTENSDLDTTTSLKDSEQPPDEEPISQGFLPVLQNTQFLILWGGQIFSQLADKIYLVLTIAIVASSFQIAGQPISLWVSPITIAFTIPAILFGSLAGVYVDRWSKKSILVFSNLFRGAFVLILPVLLWFAQGKVLTHNISLGFLLLLTVTLFVSTLTQFFAPAEQAAIPLLVPKQDLLAANSIYTTTIMALLIVGFAVGEPLLELADHLVGSWGFADDIGKEILVGGAYAIAGIILIGLKIEQDQGDPNSENAHPLQDIGEGIQYLKTNLKVRNALIQLIILFSIFAALVVLAVSLADKIPEIEADEFGILLAATGLGMAVSAAIIGNLGQRFSNAQLSFWGSLGIAASLAGLSYATGSFWLAFIMSSFMGAFASLIGVPMQTTIQSETPPDMRGKVFGLQNNAVNIALSLPLVLAAEAEAYFGLESVILGLAAIALLGGVITRYLAR
ncbi:arabinose efflux permease family protein [Xenococcus sp. PCC 7305]|uniref:MFS transporter n=1 Tax=Xenococcus sp. PCC 7305 TaxID=102125 RepID=UPI0002AC05A0|nr:MFS transporter [Xenococcus sp. PCC 7305]ELS01090.1 arabinose efflux permease family protein [Xenococcus sp. PCC 7305]